MNAAQSRLEIAADNLANAHSEGFHRHVAAFEMTANGLRARNGSVATPGPLRETGRALDIALTGPGALYVAPLHAGGPEKHAMSTTRGGSFTRNAAGYVVDDGGRALIGRHGFIRLADDRVSIAADGTISANGQKLDRLATAPGTRVAGGFIEMSNVDSIGEMMAILDAHRAFETAQKSLIALDIARQKAIDDAGLVK